MRLVTVLYIVLIIAIIVGANTGQLPHFLDAVNELPYGDKVAHFFLMGILSFLVNSSALITLRGRKHKQVVLLTTLVLLSLILLEEVSQFFLPRRTLSLLDLTSDFLGVSLAAWLAYRWRQSSAPPEEVRG
ncbi:MAG: VanZ family protein [Anaerolineales bacterium]|nr:VanZ family protein [Anaerolineales bacterium]